MCSMVILTAFFNLHANSWHFSPEGYFEKLHSLIRYNSLEAEKEKKKEKEKEKEKKQQKSANSELLWLGWYAQVQRVNILEDIICFFWIYDYELRQNTLEMGKPW